MPIRNATDRYNVTHGPTYLFIDGLYVGMAMDGPTGLAVGDESSSPLTTGGMPVGYRKNVPVKDMTMVLDGWGADIIAHVTDSVVEDSGGVVSIKERYTPGVARPRNIEVFIHGNKRDTWQVERFRGVVHVQPITIPANDRSTLTLTLRAEGNPQTFQFSDKEFHPVLNTNLAVSAAYLGSAPTVDILPDGAEDVAIDDTFIVALSGPLLPVQLHDRVFKLEKVVGSVRTFIACRVEAEYDAADANNDWTDLTRIHVTPLVDLEHEKTYELTVVIDAMSFSGLSLTAPVVVDITTEDAP